MTPPPVALEQAAKQASAGKPVRVTVRQLLSWFGVSRRGTNVVDHIDRTMTELSLESRPHFAEVWIDQEIELVPRGAPAGSQAAATAVTAPATSESVPASAAEDRAVVLQIGALEEANAAPDFVTPDASIEQAVSMLRLSPHPVLAVLSGDRRQAKGVLTWRELALASQANPRPKTVQELLKRWPAETALELVRSDSDVFALAGLVSARGFAFVRGADGTVCGPITSGVLARLFVEKLEPFVLAGEVEHTLRAWIAAVFSDIDRDKLTIGECQRLLQDPERWKTLGIRFDRAVFNEKLEAVREIRNDLMHFNPDRLDERSVATLRRFVLFLRDECRPGRLS